MNHPNQQGHGQQYGQPQQGYAQAGYGQPQAGPPMYYPPKKKKPWLLIIGLVLGIPLLLAVGIVGLGLFYLASAEETAPSASELKAVLTVDDLGPYIEGFTPDKSVESKTKHKYIDDSYDIEYEYEDDELYLNSTMTVEPSESDASATFGAQNFGSSLGGSIAGGDIEFEERNDIYKWGDESEFIIMKSEGKPYGNLFTCRKGKKVFYVMWSGVYFDEAEWAAELLDPVMQRVQAYK